jgi:hypothetical protein
MPQTAREPYRSANGDGWSLVLDDVVGVGWQVLHESNRASGGQVSRTEISDFRIGDAHGPQLIELLRLIGSLVV